MYCCGVYVQTSNACWQVLCGCHGSTVHSALRWCVCEKLGQQVSRSHWQGDDISISRFLLWYYELNKKVITLLLILMCCRIVMLLAWRIQFICNRRSGTCLLSLNTASYNIVFVGMFFIITCAVWFHNQLCHSDFRTEYFAWPESRYPMFVELCIRLTFTVMGYEIYEQIFMS